MEGEVVHKIRYYYPYENQIAEMDVFQGELEGLVLIDFEFEIMEKKDSFKSPDFCLVEVTQENLLQVV
ncbi:MAG: hypothetical protein DRP06_00015 [Candidatus Aenigmatarchaeota archaeon]|nr:MAG: hypothetical protein DRP06_00015 [Candidatus Aenigmarchaeota archaeon]